MTGLSCDDDMVMLADLEKCRERRDVRAAGADVVVADAAMR
jgi:hypothetical protein